jgi:hypothetical protein
MPEQAAEVVGMRTMMSPPHPVNRRQKMTKRVASSRNVTAASMPHDVPANLGEINQAPRRSAPKPHADVRRRAGHKADQKVGDRSPGA